MDHNNNSLKILSWNANSLRNKIFLLYDFLRDNNIKIACIYEIFFLPNDVIPADGDFKMHRIDRENDNNQRSGGVAILVHREIKHSLLPKPPTKLLESLSVEVQLHNNSKIRFTSAYLPGGASVAQINQHYKNDIRILTSSNTPYYICGDFNSKHRLWNCHRGNRAGLILHHEYLSREFIILHPNEPTYYSSATNRIPSTIDLVLTTVLCKIISSYLFFT